MKMTTGILGCALAAGLMTFAADNAQAGGIVIGNNLYLPLNLKVKVTYNSGNTNDTGKLKTASVSSKTVLNKLGYKGYTLAYDYFGDVYVINPKTKPATIVTDLTEDGIMSATIDDNVYYEKYGKNGAYKYTGAGILTLQFDSNGGLNTSTNTVVNNVTSFDGYYAFDISGIYAEKYSESADNKQFYYNVKDSLTAPHLSGTGIDTDLQGETTLPVAGNAKFSGNGKLSDD